MLELSVLRELSKSDSSGVSSVKKRIHLALDPGYADRVTQGITDCLGSYLHQYYPGVSGVLLGYGGVKLKKNSVIYRDLPHIHVDIQATFYIFHPSPGSFLLGTVQKIGEGHVGLCVHHVFYASILKTTESAAEWAGSKLSVGDRVKFKVEAISYVANKIVILAGSEDIEKSATTLQAKAANTRHKMIEHFPVRRSQRKPNAELLKEQMEGLEARLLANDDDNLGLKVTIIENKGRGIIAMRDFCKGEFVVEYAGDFINSRTAEDRERKYSMDTSTGCYMYYFKHMGKSSYCMDATSEIGRFGRLVNHSRVTPNCVTKVVTLGNTPRLILVAKADIVAGTEVLYNYGDTDKESLQAHPWLSL